MTRRKQPEPSQPTAEDLLKAFRDHARQCRRAGAKKVSACFGDFAFDIEWPGNPPRPDNVIGFMSDAAPEEYDDEE